MTTVETFRVRRDQHMGGGVYRTYGELIPEAHTFFAHEHLLHTGEIEDTEVEEAEFRAAVEQYCPELAEQIYDRVGLSDDVAVQGPQNSPRREVMVPAELPAHATPQTVKPLPKLRGRQAGTRITRQSTVLATDAAPGALTSEDDHSQTPTQQEDEMVQRTDGDRDYFEGATADDPAELAVITRTTPADIAAQNPDAAYELPEPVEVSPADLREQAHGGATESTEATEAGAAAPESTQG